MVLLFVVMHLTDLKFFDLRRVWVVVSRRMLLRAWALATAVLAATSAWAKPASPSEVRRLLDSPEVGTTKPADWHRLGDDVDVRLIEVAADSRTDAEARARAVEALGEVSTRRARHFLQSLLNAEQATPELVAAAVQAFSAILAPAAPDEALRVDEKFLIHPDWEVREAAARALGKLGTPAAEQVLKDRWPRERSGVVKLALSAALIETHRHR